MIAYCHCNAANMFFTTELAEILKKKGVCSFTSASGWRPAPQWLNHLSKGFGNLHIVLSDSRPRGSDILGRCF